MPTDLLRLVWSPVERLQIESVYLIMSEPTTMIRLAAVGAILGASLPAAMAEEPLTELPDTQLIRGQPACFSINRIRDFDFLDDKNLVVWVGRRTAYHVELLTKCLNLEDALGLEFRSRTNRFCGGAGDYITVANPFRRQGDLEERCSVRNVRALDEEGLYELSVDAGKYVTPPPIAQPEIDVVAPGAEAENDIVVEPVESE